MFLSCNMGPAGPWLVGPFSLFFRFAILGHEWACQGAYSSVFRLAIEGTVGPGPVVAFCIFFQLGALWPGPVGPFFAFPFRLFFGTLGGPD